MTRQLGGHGGEDGAGTGGEDGAGTGGEDGAGTGALPVHDRRGNPPVVAPSVPEVAPSGPVAAPASAAHRDRARMVFKITGMDCADCAASIERQVAHVPGVRAANVHLMAAKLVVEPEAAAAPPAAAIQRAVRDAGYTALPDAAPDGADSPGRFRRFAALWPTLTAALLWTVAFAAGLLQAPEVVSTAAYATASVIGGFRIARRGLYALARGRTLGIDLLMTIAIVGAALIGEWAEAAAVVVLFALGELLEGLTMDKARNAIRGLMDLSPREATLKGAAGERRVPVESLLPGDHIVVRPGELVAADGRVTDGVTTIDQASITGESMPVEKVAGDEVFAGTANQRGYVEVEVSKRWEDTTLARIISLVEEAQSSRAPAQRFVDRFARVYTPVVLLIAALVAVVPPLLGQPFAPALYKALVLLVIACPCALVISTPVAIVAAIGRASRVGVLIKGGAYLEALGAIRVLAFDKTGTLTEGRPAVTDVLPLGGHSRADVLALAAAVESRSEHPLAGAILRAAREQGVGWSTPRAFEALPGRGARAVVDGVTVTIGSVEMGAPAPAETLREVARLQAEGKTALLVGRAGELAGLIAVADRMRPEAEGAVAALRAAGVRMVMLTGDNARTAGVVAGRLGLDETRAGLLPDEKTAAIVELLGAHGAIAMVGDGVNDAPALARATVGIAMGAAGSDAALETADVALMGDDLLKLPYLLRLSRAALRTIRVNIAFSIAVKALFLLLTLAGIANLWLAILADTGAALLVIANGMRLLRFGADEAAYNTEAPAQRDARASVSQVKTGTHGSTS